MRPASRKIWPSGRLAARLARERAKGKRIVFTNGVFDLLHAGHVTVLEQARALGDCLVVGLNSDASVRRLKGPKRPISPFADRATVIGSMQSVDYVTAFEEDTPRTLIQKLKPAILVKGGDYKADQIVGREFVKKVVRIPLVKGCSSTNLIERILKAYGR